MAQSDLPDLFQGNVGISSGVGGRIRVLHCCRRGRFILRKLYAVGLRLRPRFSEVVRRTQVGTPVGTVDCRPEALAAVAIVVGKSVDRSTGKIWSADVPLLALFI